jgi:alpha-glucosidase
MERLMEYYGAQGSGVHLPFNFQLIELPWHARAIAEAIDRYEALLPPYGWPNWVLGNHDNPRIASRVGPDSARVAAMLLLTLRGTPTLYYGDEIGMRDVPIPPGRVQDPFEKNVPGLGLGRDPERTPMQWSARENAGFTTGRPWLPIAEDYRSTNVEAQAREPASMLSFYRRLIQLRRREPALSIGHYTAIPTNGDLLCYRRQFDTALNFGSEEATFRNQSAAQRGVVALSTHMDREGERLNGHVALRGDEGLIIEATDT